MIVCVCNGLRDKVCRETAASGEARNVGCIYRLNGCQVRCGRCVPMMREIFAAHAPQPPVSGSCAACAREETVAVPTAAAA
ncbi:(2Fe-2S)-binding protein [Benzoatithermus flavus]|uniref:(2Fe-2S)-binding protein n=1 Tax=Benzoatithermus flavus TaxID=3108223 RepID=A0ABU8XTN9_9PROT